MAIDTPAGNPAFTVLFDAGPLVNGPKTGIGYYTFGLIDSLARAHPDTQFVGHYYDFLGRRGNLDLPTGANIRYRPTRVFPGQLISVLRMLGIGVPFEWLIKQGGDFIIFPSYLTQPSLSHIPMTVLVHDLAFIDMPDTLVKINRVALQRFVPVSLKRASFITTISNATAERIREHFKPDKDILVTHIPPVKTLTIPAAQAADLRTGLGLSKAYILFVSTLEPRKNIPRLLEAYAALPAATRKKYSLVLAGGEGWHNDELIQQLATLRAQGHDIITPGYVSDEQRAALYQGASLFVFPSLYEGFGMPPLEAMTYDVPVLCSNIPVLREVCDDAALYCDPNSSADIAKQMEKVLDSEAVANKLRAAGRSRLKAFDWDKIADDFYTALRKAVSSQTKRS